MSTTVLIVVLAIALVVMIVLGECFYLAVVRQLRARNEFQSIIANTCQVCGGRRGCRAPAAVTPMVIVSRDNPGGT